MPSSAVLQSAYRAGLFDSLASADRAVERLLAAGFPKSQIAVLCTDEAKERHFRELGYQPPTESEAPDGVSAGAFVGATMCGLAAIAVSAATGGVPLIIAGAAGVSGGSVMGGFLGAIMEGEAQNKFVTHFDHELQSGKILVLAQAQGSDNDLKLAEAASILAGTSSGEALAG
ncbi:MAG: hypothetical protein NT069_15495 [Planctomycetota bacterium]|nr:hypothetical protein [Planctomycetota bacterium]